MPTYKYKREDGTEFEVVHSIKEKWTTCPDTGQKVTRIINWEGQTIIRGWSPDKEKRQQEWIHKNPGGTTLPEYQNRINENTQKAHEMEAKARPNIKEV